MGLRELPSDEFDGSIGDGLVAFGRGAQSCCHGGWKSPRLQNIARFFALLHCTLKSSPSRLFTNRISLQR
jgi:hypothetical protein